MLGLRSSAVRHKMFIDSRHLFEFKVRRSEIYVAPKGALGLRATASYKYCAPNGTEPAMLHLSGVSHRIVEVTSIDRDYFDE